MLHMRSPSKEVSINNRNFITREMLGESPAQHAIVEQINSQCISDCNQQY